MGIEVKEIFFLSFQSYYKEINNIWWGTFKRNVKKPGVMETILHADMI